MKTHSIDQLFGKVECEADRSYVASPVRVKEVRLGERRYIVCLNEDQREKDAADREAILVSLREKLKQGDKALVGNHGYRKYLMCDSFGGL